MNATFLTICGNLTSDPQFRTTQSGVPVADIRVASTERRRDDSGNWIDATTIYYRVTCWRRLGERVARCLHRGDPVVVFGKFLGRSWTNDDGSYTCFELEGLSVGPDLKFVEAPAQRQPRTSDAPTPSPTPTPTSPPTSTPTPSPTTAPAPAPAPAANAERDPWGGEVGTAASEPAA